RTCLSGGVAWHARWSTRASARLPLSAGIRHPGSMTLFPYATLFRSQPGNTASASPCMAASMSATPSRSPCCSRETATEWRSWKRSEEHTTELQSLRHLVCRLLLEKKKYYPDDP